MNSQHVKLWKRIQIVIIMLIFIKKLYSTNIFIQQSKFQSVPFLKYIFHLIKNLSIRVQALGSFLIQFFSILLRKAIGWPLCIETGLVTLPFFPRVQDSTASLWLVIFQCVRQNFPGGTSLFV